MNLLVCNIALLLTLLHLQFSMVWHFPRRLSVGSSCTLYTFLVAGLVQQFPVLVRSIFAIYLRRDRPALATNLAFRPSIVSIIERRHLRGFPTFPERGPGSCPVQLSAHFSL